MEHLRWEDYGIFSLIIGAMFVLLAWVLKYHELERREMISSHKGEREEWEKRSEARLSRIDAAMQRREDRLEQVLRELTQAVREIHADNLRKRREEHEK